MVVEQAARARSAPARPRSSVPSSSVSTARRTSSRISARDLGDGRPRRGALLEPLRCLPVGLMPAPGVEVTSSRRLHRPSRRFARVYPVRVNLPDRVEQFIRDHDLIPRARRIDRASSRAERTRPVSGTCCASSATACRPCTSTMACAGRSRTPMRASVRSSSARRSSTAAAARRRTSCATIRYSFAIDRLRATGHTASRPGRDGALPARRQRRHEGDQAEARGRRRAPAARRVAQRDGGVLPRGRASPSERTRRMRTRSAG